MRAYKHFLSYDQLCQLDIEYGVTDLYFDLDASFLYIKEADSQNGKESELKFPLKKEYERAETVLEDFLVDLFSYPGNFYGRPLYEKSAYFSKEKFEELREEGISRFRKIREEAIVLNKDNELIKYCQVAGLSPEPTGSNLTNWRARCPSGGQHQIMISTSSNQWGCGYCRKKGKIEELREWVESRVKRF